MRSTRNGGTGREEEERKTQDRLLDSQDHIEREREQDLDDLGMS